MIKYEPTEAPLFDLAGSKSTLDHQALLRAHTKRFFFSPCSGRLGPLQDCFKVHTLNRFIDLPGLRVNHFSIWDQSSNV
jgi:hypothetical protein